MVRRHWKVAMIVAALAVAAWGAMRTYAWFSDSVTMNGHTFTTGTLEISLDEGNPLWQGNFGNMQPGDTITFHLTVESVGTLPLNYTIDPSLKGRLSKGDRPCQVTGIRVDDSSTTADSLSAKGGDDPEDLVEIDITMPIEAGSEYEGKSGHLVATFSATQQE